MRLGDFRKETANLSDDYILDHVMFIQTLPAHYDGLPSEYNEHKSIYQNLPKIRFYIFDSHDWFWDVCENNISYEENLKYYLTKFHRGENIDDAKWNEYITHKKIQFALYWNETEWQKYLKEKDLK